MAGRSLRHSKAAVVYTHTYSSPVGPLYLALDRWGRVLGISFVSRPDLGGGVKYEENRWACGELAWQLNEYFAGRLEQFSVDVALTGTPFQVEVWKRLRKIPYGEVMSYGVVAQKIGRQRAAQAVGNAVAANPVPLIVPCHRVVRTDGDIGEYAARSLGSYRGRQVKAELLRIEGTFERLSQPTLFPAAGASQTSA